METGKNWNTPEYTITKKGAVAPFPYFVLKQSISFLSWQTSLPLF